MLSSIHHPTSGLESPVLSPAKETAGAQLKSDPFGTVMNRTLARNSGDAPADRPPGQPESKPTQQKTLPRSCSHPSPSAGKPVSGPVKQDPRSPSDGPTSSKDGGSHGKGRSTASLRRRDSGSANDALPGMEASTVPLISAALAPAPGPKGSNIQAVTTVSSAAAALNGADAEASSRPTSVRPGGSWAKPSAKSATTPTPRADLQMDHSVEKATPAASSPEAGDKPQLAGQSDDPENIVLSDPVQTDPSKAQIPAADGSAPSETTGSGSVDGSISQSAGDGAQIKLHSKLMRDLLPAGTGNESPQSLGTSAAQEESSMKKAEKVQKTAEPSLQNLPSGGAVTAGQAKPTAAETLLTSPSFDLEKVAVASSAGQIESPAAPAASMANTSTVSTMVDARLTSIERTHDLVAMHALRLSQSGSDSLRIVLEPGGGTRLSLELRFSNGTVEAQAQLHRGDFQFLSNHWADLQQRLEPRGIHLGALKCSDESNGGQERFQRSGGQSADEQPNRSAFAEFALDGAMADSKASKRVRPKTNLGWETWA